MVGADPGNKSRQLQRMGNDHFGVTIPAPAVGQSEVLKQWRYLNWGLFLHFQVGLAMPERRNLFDDLSGRAVGRCGDVDVLRQCGIEDGTVKFNA